MLDPFSQDKKDNPNNKILINKFIPYNSTKMKNQNKIIINNIEIFFPFPPHEIQIIYMKKILHNLNQKFLLKEKYKAIAALESPIGTGKTLCLLCASFAWVNEMKKTNNYKGKIIYTAKSYNRISHIINELNKTYYKPKISILFSPYESCINNKVNNSKNDKITFLKCKNSIYTCEFYKNNLNFENNINEFNEDDYLDIEDLSDFLCNNKICPFFYSKNNISNSDIIFMPYEFLFDKNMKKMLDIDIDDNIIIIDESHNLPKLCQEVNTLSINTDDLEEIIQELSKIIKNKHNDFDLNKSNRIGINDIKCEILAINKIINNINNNNLHILQGEVYPDKGLILSSKVFLSLFLSNTNLIRNNNKNNNSNYNEYEFITLDNISKHIYLLKYIQKLLFLNYEKNSKLLSLYISILEKINYFYVKQNDHYIDSYIFFLSYIKKDDDLNISNNSNNSNQIRKLKLYCFDPSLSFKEMLEEKPYAIFLTSDTLTPFDILEKEFKLKFDIKLENEHIIKNDQFNFSLIQSSLYNNEKIIFQLDYIHRSNVKMIIALGYTLHSLCIANKYGSILVYFPSMVYLNQCNLIWKDNNIIDNLQEINNIYYSQKNLKKLKKLKNDKNYIFFVVFDKNTSPEEIFFREANVNMVVCLGVPYDTEYNFDDKIQLKIKYLDDNIKSKYKGNNYNYNINNELTGEKWYEKNYICLINRFLGKSLKLLSGYGSLRCIDNRYESPLNNGIFSSYLKNNCQIINIDNNNYFNSLNSFLGKIKNNFNKSFNLYNNNIINNIIYEKNKNKIIHNFEEDEDTENYFINKKYNNKIFNLANKEKNQLNDLINDTKKLEELILNPSKLNKYLNNINYIPTKKKSTDFLNKKTNLQKEENSDNSEDENNNNTKNKKLKIEEENNYQNRNISIKNNYINISNYKLIKESENTFNNSCNGYDSNNNNNNIKKDINEEDKKIIDKNNNNENINDNNDNDNDMNENIQFEPNPEILEQLNNNSFTDTTKNVYDCPICFKTSSQNPNLIYSISKCKHVLCNICWSGWLAEKLECPLCKGKARPKTLKRLIFTYN